MVCHRRQMHTAAPSGARRLITPLYPLSNEKQSRMIIDNKKTSLKYIHLYIIFFFFKSGN